MPEGDVHEVDELLPVWLKPCGERLALSPVNGAKGSSGGGVEGGHPETMESGWMANTRRSGGANNWPPVLLSEGNVTPLIGIVSQSPYR